MCQHPACAAETRIRSKDCDVTIVDRMGSRDAFPIPFPSFIYGVTVCVCVCVRVCVMVCVCALSSLWSKFQCKIHGLNRLPQVLVSKCQLCPTETLRS